MVSILHDSLLMYLLEATLCLSVCYITYTHLLYKLTYFQWNRWYFIASLGLSLAVPFIHIPLSVELTPDVYNQSIQFINPLTNQALVTLKAPVAKESESLVAWNQIIWIIYLSGLLRYSIIFIRNLQSIRSLVQKSAVSKQKGYILVRTPANTPAFSFGSYVFLNSQYEQLSEKQKEQVLMHELVHVRQKHTIDRLLFELTSILFWFNPLMHKINNAVSEIHEYIVDSEVVKNKIDADYSKLIVQLTLDGKPLTLANNFSMTQVKSRLYMLKAPEPHSLRKLRFLAALPVVLLIIVLFSIPKAWMQTTEANTLSEKTRFTDPIEGEYTVIAGFFEHQTASANGDIWMLDDAMQVSVSHKKIAYSAADFSPVVAVEKGSILKIDSTDNWGVTEYSVEIEHSVHLISKYEGLYTLQVNKGDTVQKGQHIATTGDSRLYPYVSYQLLKNNKAINPNEYF